MLKMMLCFRIQQSPSQKLNEAEGGCSLIHRSKKEVRVGVWSIVLANGRDLVVKRKFGGKEVYQTLLSPQSPSWLML
jgi:hypothetical protein